MQKPTVTPNLYTPLKKKVRLSKWYSATSFKPPENGTYEVRYKVNNKWVYIPCTYYEGLWFYTYEAYPQLVRVFKAGIFDIKDFVFRGLRTKSKQSSSDFRILAAKAVHTMTRLKG